MQIGIKELRDKLSSVVAEAERGEDVIITRDGCPVARLVAMEAPHVLLRPPLSVRKATQGHEGLSWLYAAFEDGEPLVPVEEVDAMLEEARRDPAP